MSSEHAVFTPRRSLRTPAPRLLPDIDLSPAPRLPRSASGKRTSIAKKLSEPADQPSTSVAADPAVASPAVASPPAAAAAPVASPVAAVAPVAEASSAVQPAQSVFCRSSTLFINALVFIYAFDVAIMTAAWLSGSPFFKNPSRFFAEAELLFPATITDVVSVPFEAAYKANLFIFSYWFTLHTLGARAAFTHFFNKLIGFPASLEWPLYVLLSALLSHYTVLSWIPINDVAWNLSCTETDSDLCAIILSYVYFTAVLLAFATVLFNGNHFGLCEGSQSSFSNTGLYARLRHPIHFLLIIALWSTSTMQVGQLIIASLGSAFLLFHAALQDVYLLAKHGDAYAEYKRTTPFLARCPVCSTGRCPGCQIGSWVASLFVLPGDLENAAAASQALAKAKPAPRQPTQADSLFSDDES
eukprot:m.18960 g.18960  ORF g.18960 m.18960 type:complete len:414 (-) comp30580_c0_seq3:2989-4230(-)